jgi:four helix bundle protein
MQQVLKDRTKALALGIIRLCRTLPTGAEFRILAGQVIRSSTSTAANYRSACRARTRREFVAKLGVVIEEADETLFWLEVLGDLEPEFQGRVASIVDEANQLTAVFVVTRHSARRKLSARRQKA